MLILGLSVGVVQVGQLANVGLIVLMMKTPVLLRSLNVFDVIREESSGAINHVYFTFNHRNID